MDQVFNSRPDTQQANAILQIQSTTPDEMPNILVWQLGLEIAPSDTATGNVGFKEMHIPDNYLFPGMSFPMSIPNLPQSTPPSSITISDFFVPGVALVDNTPRNLITLDFQKSVNASGIFHLVLSPFSNSTLNSSMWASELILDPADAQEFENGRANSSYESRVLATILVNPIPEPNSVIIFGIGLIGIAVSRKRSSIVCTLRNLQ